MNSIFKQWLFLLVLLIPLSALADSQKTCAYIASYAPGYGWQEGISKGLQKTLLNQCRLKTFYMNSKRLSGDAELKAVALQAVAFIEESKPDVVIVSDDHAIKYVLQQHYKNSPIPFVFCGVNNSAKRYGLPYKNTTGMIEKNPLAKLLKLVFSLQPAKTRVAMLTTVSTSANINAQSFIDIADKFDIQHIVYQVNNQQEWQQSYLNIQNDPYIDILLFANKEPIDDWDEQANLVFIKKHNKKLSITMQPFMMPYNALGLTKVPEEQGEWAGLAAIEILSGTKPEKISVVPNERFNLWVNPMLIKPFRTYEMDLVIKQAIVYESKDAL